MCDKFRMTADDIGWAWEQAISCLPKESDVYSLPIASSGNDIKAGFFTAEERSAYESFFVRHESLCNGQKTNV